MTTPRRARRRRITEDDLTASQRSFKSKLDLLEIASSVVGYGGHPILQFSLPAIEGDARFSLNEDEAEKFLEADLRGLVRLGNYMAIYSAMSGEVEVAFTERSQSWLEYLFGEEY